MPLDTLGEDVGLGDEEGEIWSVAGTEEVVSEVEGEVQVADWDIGHCRQHSQATGVCDVVPQFLKGSYRNVMRVALEEAIAEAKGVGGKLFMMLPRMLLHREPRGGLVLVTNWFACLMISRSEWSALIQASGACDEQAAVGRRRRRRRPGDDLERRAARAEMLVHLGELSSARQALEGASVASGSNQSLAMLSDRLPILRDPIPEEVTHHVPSSPLELDEHRRSSICAFCWTTPAIPRCS